MFVVFEGGDGAGKTSQMNQLAAKLHSEGHSVVVTCEPGGTQLGQLIRRLVLYGGEVSEKAEALLYAADRAHHVETVIRPALELGATVLCDRYIGSSIAYQGTGRSLGSEEICRLNEWASGGLLPDKTILLDLPVAVGQQRIGKTLDRIESAPQEFHEKVRQSYLDMAKADPVRWSVIDADRESDEVFAAVWSACSEAILGGARTL